MISFYQFFQNLRKKNLFKHIIFDLYKMGPLKIGQKLEQPKQNEFTFKRWEIIMHSVIVAVHLTLMVKLVYQYTAQHETLGVSQSYLTPIIGRKRDSHDIQWETYRQNLPILVICIFGWWIVSPKIEKYPNEKSWIFGSLILFYMMRADLLFYSILLIIWYYFTLGYSRKKWFVPACWILCLIIFYANEATSHFKPLSQWISSFLPEWFSLQQRKISWGQILNITFLRLLSFSIDYSRGSEDKQLQKHRQKCAECLPQQPCLKGRDLIHGNDFSIQNYFNYMLFAPAIFTGPPISYNSFCSFRLFPRKNSNYGVIKVLFLLIAFQVYQHICPSAIGVIQAGLFRVQSLMLFQLVFIWFKFLIIWRIGRAWAALCGIEVVDNLPRCVCNNYGFQGFWRMWHRGFNLWLVRYLYIPLGGKNNFVSVIATIAFVAFWHDHTFNILLWAAVIVVCMLPELVIKRYSRKNLGHLYPKQWFKYLSAFASSAYIYLLVLCNILGFGNGYEKLDIFWEKVKSELFQLIWSMIVLSSAVILMFYLRSIEKDKRNY